MRKYNITVNGNTYEVEVEEAGESNAPNTQNNIARETITANNQVVEPNKNERPKVETSKQGTQKVVAETISAPMPGSIFDIKVSAGDIVKEGDTLLILEAMKMENEIMAPRDGKIAEVNVSKGQSVDTGETLVSLE